MKYLVLLVVLVGCAPVDKKYDYLGAVQDGIAVCESFNQDCLVWTKSGIEERQEVILAPTAFSREYGAPIVAHYQGFFEDFKSISKSDQQSLIDFITLGLLNAPFQVDEKGNVTRAGQ